MELMQEGLSILLQAALRKGKTIEAHSLLDQGARLNSDLIKFANLSEDDMLTIFARDPQYTNDVMDYFLGKKWFKLVEFFVKKPIKDGDLTYIYPLSSL